MKNKATSADMLLKRIQSSDICKGTEPKDAKPLLNFSAHSKILIVGQAPGLKAITSRKPWNDKSGERLREWLDLSDDEFYDANKVAIVPMDFCYPGKGKSGDLPPRPICAETWMNEILDELLQIQTTILVGQYAQKYFLNERCKENLTNTVKNWKSYAPEFCVLPHPSPRNNIWLAKNLWFEKNLVPEIQKVVRRALK